MSHDEDGLERLMAYQENAMSTFAL